MVDRLGRDAPVVTDPTVTAERVYLDTADWRLYRAGWSLEFEAGSTLTLREVGTDEPRVSASISLAPARGADLPAGPAWDATRRILEERHLLVQLAVQVRTQRLAILNRDGKTTCRVHLSRYRVSPAPARTRVLRAAAVWPVRGYDRAAQVETLLGGMGLQRAGTPLMVELLAAAGQPEPGVNLGPGVALDRSQPAARAIGAVLDRLRGHVLANEEGVRRQLDTEFLHDYRVAIRRARSIVRQAAGILPADQVAVLAAELGWLAGLTSLPRDLDVHLEELGARPEPEIKPLLAYLAERRARVQTELVAALDSERYKKLLDRWQTVAGSSPSAAGGAVASAGGVASAGAVADEHVRRAFRKVIKRGRAIDATSPPEALHDLRKRAKELRYLLECFQALYPDAERAAAVKELKLLQDNLGEYQDCQVQAAALRAMAEDLMEERAAPAATLMALGRLADDLETRERRARAEFEDRFAQFASPENRRRYAALTSKVSA